MVVKKHLYRYFENQYARMQRINAFAGRQIMSQAHWKSRQQALSDGIYAANDAPKVTDCE